MASFTTEVCDTWIIVRGKPPPKKDFFCFLNCASPDSFLISTLHSLPEGALNVKSPKSIICSLPSFSGEWEAAYDNDTIAPISKMTIIRKPSQNLILHLLIGLCAANNLISGNHDRRK